MRITGDIKTFDPMAFARSLANLFDSEARYFRLEYFTSGSVITYFYIADPLPTDSDSSLDKPTTIRSLSGNEKTLLLYQWYVTDDPILDTLPFKILDYQLFYDDILADGNSTVVQLFVPYDAPPVNPIVPTRVAIDNGQIQILPAQPILKTVVDVPLPVGSASMRSVSLLVNLIVVLVSTLLLFDCL